jgi:hypothetical protein
VSDPAGRVSRKRSLLWFLVCAAASSAWCVAAARQLGPVWDEPFYLDAGLRAWHQLHPGQLLAEGVMPLPPAVQTLPLLVSEKIRGRPISLQEEFDSWLPVARAGTLLFWWLLLAAGWWLGWRWGGPTAGALAVGLLAAEPVLLGLASLATTDLALTASLLALLAAYEAGRGRGWGRRVLVPAGAAGLALLAKASALLFAPVCLAAAELAHRGRRPPRTEGEPAAAGSWLRSAANLAQIGLLSLVPVFAFCRGSRALDAVRFQIKHNAQGHGPVFLLGEVSAAGFWYYFPMTVLIKVGLPVLLLGLVVLAARPRGLWNGPFLACLALLALSPLYRVQIGVRFVLPAVALLIVGVGIAAARWLETRSGWGLAAWVGAGAALCWSAAGALQVWPHGICFTNELWGGTGKGYLALSDSNYDWGQGLRELAAWQKAHSQAPLDVWYFGTDPAIERFPVRRVDLCQVASGGGSPCPRAGALPGREYNTCPRRSLRQPGRALPAGAAAVRPDDHVPHLRLHHRGISR